MDGSVLIDNDLILRNNFESLVPIEKSICAAWSPSDHHLAILDARRNVTIIDAHNNYSINNRMAVIDGSPGRHNIAYTHDGKYLLVGNTTISVFDANNYKLLHTIPQPFYEVQDSRSVLIWSLSVSPDSKSVVVYYLGLDRKHGIAVFDIISGALNFNKILPYEWVPIGTVLKFNEDGESVLFPAGGYFYDNEVLKRDYALYSINVKTGDYKIIIPSCVSTKPSGMELSPSGKMIAISTAADGVDARTNKYTKKLVGFNNEFSLKIFNLLNNQVVADYVPEGGVFDLAFSQNEQYIIASTYNSDKQTNIIVINLGNGELTKTFITPPGMDIYMSHDDTHLASLGEKYIHIYCGMFE